MFSLSTIAHSEQALRLLPVLLPVLPQVNFLFHAYFTDEHTYFPD